jgi:hypothetical protein
MIRRDIASRTGADGRPLAVFRFAPNSRTSHTMLTQIRRRALDHSVRSLVRFPQREATTGWGKSPATIIRIRVPNVMEQRRNERSLRARTRHSAGRVATQRPPSGGLFVQCSGTEKNKKTASKAGMPKTKGANSINMAHPGVRSSAWSSAPCFLCPPVDVHGNLDRLG